MASDTFVRIENQDGVLVAIFSEITKKGPVEKCLTAEELRKRLDHFQHLQPRHTGFNYTQVIAETNTAIAAMEKAMRAAQTPAQAATQEQAPDPLRLTA
ncbi:MAG: hypothetical protein L6Q57_08380 [Alphaproteobacteria bacterium]|nr:hypothetical protein [Alphaproteobacteria bacterium]